MYCRFALVIFISLMASASAAVSQVATFDSGSIYDLDPKVEQSTGSRILERMLGNDDMQSIAELSRSDIIRRLSLPVGRLTLVFKKGWLSPQQKGAYCTASLIAKDLILTNHHCVPGKGNVEKVLLTMGYLKPRTRKGVAQYPVRLKPIEASRDLDYAILKVEGNPGGEWGTIGLSDKTPDALSTLFVIHHPGGFPKYVTRGRCQTSDPAIDGHDLLHKCDTLPGSSGAPIFDNNSRKVVALHYSAVALRGLNAGKQIASLAQASPLIARLVKPKEPKTQSPKSSDVRLSEAAMAWADIKASKDPEDFKAFRRQYGKSNRFYDRLAEKRLAALRPPVKAPKPPPKSGQEAPAIRPGKTFRDCKTCPEMVVVPAGSFMMGSPKSEKGREKDEGPEHSVTFAKSFAVGKSEITRAQFATFVAATDYKMGNDCWTYEKRGDNKWNWEKTKNRHWQSPGYEQTGGHPVVCVSWNDANAYIAWLNKKVSGARYRLMTEAEWEYSARANSKTRYSYGDNPDQLCRHSNGTDRTPEPKTGATWSKFSKCKDGHYYTAPVQSYKANSFGLHDMHGNVWEWVQDCYKDNYKSAPVDGSAVTLDNCSRRVLRGGSWLNGPQGLRSANRSRNYPGNRSSFSGFRVVRMLTP